MFLECRKSWENGFQLQKRTISPVVPGFPALETLHPRRRSSLGADRSESLLKFLPNGESQEGSREERQKQNKKPNPAFHSTPSQRKCELLKRFVSRRKARTIFSEYTTCVGFAFSIQWDSLGILLGQEDKVSFSLMSARDITLQEFAGTRKRNKKSSSGRPYSF